MKTQFTLRQLFVCVACFGAAFALLGVAIPIWRAGIDDGQPLLGFVAGSTPFAAATLMGTGVGHLFGKAREGAIFGVAATLLALILGIGLGLIWELAIALG